MAVSVPEVEAILAAVSETGLTYMMGETSFYNPATVYARRKLADGDFGRVFYSEGDYVRHGSRLLRGLPVQRRGQLEGHRELSADALPDPPVGGVLQLDTYAVSVSCLGVRDLTATVSSTGR